MKQFGVNEPEKEYVFRPGAYALIQMDELIAVVKSPLGYFLIGGGIETGEQPETCLEREAVEETGFKIEVSEALETVQEYVTVKESSKSYLKEMTAFRASVVNRIQEPIEPDHEMVWLTKEAAIKLLYLDGQRYFVQNYL